MALIIVSMSSKPKGTSTNETGNSSLQADIALLASLLSSDESEEVDDANISELLRRLDTANGVASGVESRLDEILNNLDGLLGTLEQETAKDTAGQETKVQGEEKKGEEETKT